MKFLWNILYEKTGNCVSCKEYTAKKNSSVRKTNRNRLILLLNCATYGRKRLASFKNQKLQNPDNISND